MFGLLCLHLFFSSLSCCSHSLILYQLSKPEAKNTSPVKLAPCHYPSISFYLSKSQSLSLCLLPMVVFSLLCLLNLWICLAERTEHANVTKQPTRDCTGIYAGMTHTSSECDKCIWVKRWSPRHIVPL